MLTICTTLAALACADTGPTTPAPAPQRSDLVPLQPVVRDVGGCSQITARVIGGDSAVAVVANTPACGPLAPIIVGAPMYNRVTGILRLPVALRNQGPLRVYEPSVYIWLDSVTGASVRGARLTSPDTGGSGTQSPTGSVRWGFSDRLATAPAYPALTPGGDSARHFLRSDSVSQVRWITLVTGTATSVRLTLNAVGRHVLTVPARAPDRTPASVLAESRRPEHIVTDRGLRGRVIRDRLWVQFRPAATREQRQVAVDAVDGLVIGGQKLGFDNLYYVQIPVADTSGTGPLQRAIKTLRSMPQVRYVIYDELDAVRPTYRKPQDGNGFTRWQLDPARAQGVNWATQDIAGPLAWGCSTGDGATGVAVVDDGFFGVSDLAPNIDPNSQLTGTPNQDHGTRTSSIIGAVGNNQQGITGMMWQARLGLYYSYRPDSLAPNASYYPVYAIRNAALAGYRIINVSEGLYWTANGGSPPNIASGADSLRASNIGMALQAMMDDIETSAPSNPRPLIVLSASNDGIDAFWSGYAAAKLDANGQIDPRYANRILVVAATQQSASAANRLASYSDRGSLVDIAAPGSQVAVLDQNGATATADGASFAAPHVSGVAGLLLSFDPRLSTDSLRALVLRGAARGGRVANDPSNTARPIPVANAYLSLKAAAEHTGAPLCGNRVWVQGGAVVIARGDSASAPVETLGPIDGSAITNSYGRWSIAVEQGGRQVGVCGPANPLYGTLADAQTICTSLFTFSGGQWGTGSASGYQTTSGSALSSRAVSHTADSLLTSGRVWAGQCSPISLVTSGGTTSLGCVPITDVTNGSGAPVPTAGRGVQPAIGFKPSGNVSLVFPQNGDTALTGVYTATGIDVWGVSLHGGTVKLWSVDNRVGGPTAMSEDGTSVAFVTSDRSHTQCFVQFWSLATRQPITPEYPVNAAECSHPGPGTAAKVPIRMAVSATRPHAR